MRFKKKTDLVSSFDDRVSYEAQYLGERIIGELWQVMKLQGVSKAELARRMDRSRAYVSRMFSSGTNLTLKSISGALVALNYRLTVEAHPVALEPDEDPKLVGYPPLRTAVEGGEP